MASSAGQSVIRHLRRVAVLSDEIAETDAALLQAFISRRDEAAFAALVRRHGSMVLAVCRRVVGNPDDADDAFQATFLVLARKAHTLQDRHLLANWLYGVAYRTALEARTRMLRRSATEMTVPDFPEAATPPAADNAELVALLDRELSRLSEKYRVPVVLCELEGRSRREAAELLGIPEGTLSSRLAAARRLLAERLKRRGVAVSVAAVTAALSHRVASAALPTSLLKSTVAAATAESVAPAVLTLTQGVMKAMFLKKLQLSLALVLALGVGSGLVTLGVVGGGPATAQQDEKPQLPLVAKPKETKPAKGKNNLLGGWRVVSVAPGKNDGPTAMFFTADKGYLMMGTEGAALPFKYKLDASEKPNHIDLTLDPTVTQGDTHKLLGIVELSGDLMLLSFKDGKDADRPESFKANEESRQIVISLRRDSDIKEPDNTKAGAEKIREARERMVSQNNLKQMAIAMHNYLDANKTFPAAAIYSKDGKPLLSWRVAILPYIEHDNLYRQFHLDEPWDSEHNKPLMEKMPKVYGPKGTETHYRVFTGKDTIFKGKKGTRIADITDGTSNTILIVEGPSTVPWTKPEDFKYNSEKELPKLGGKPFKNGFSAAFADGSVRFITEKVPEKTLRALITASGNENIEQPKDDD